MKEWKHTEHLLITLRRLGKITKEVRESNVWTGYSRGFKLRIELLPGLVTLQEPISRHRMLWGLRAPGGRQLCNGAAETVLDCVRAMEAAAAEWQRLKEERAFVERSLGDSVICRDCRATLETFADACTAGLQEQCPGYIAIEKAKQSKTASEEAKS